MSVYLDLSIATGDHVQLVDWLSVPGRTIGQLEDDIMFF